MMAALLYPPLAERNLALRPSVTFVSAESRTAEDGPVTNRISFFPGNERGNGRDLWVMRQRSRGEGEDAAHWSLVAIEVDTSVTPAAAQYRELAPEPVAAGAQPRPLRPRVDCGRCHPSGPRAIRPAGPYPASPLIADWNRVIERYGAVAPAPATPRQERLDLPFCADCHDAARGLRGDLSRLQRGSIEFLVARGAMPLGERPLPLFQRRCLDDWLAGRDVPAKCREKPAPAPAGLVAAVRTNLGPGFEVTGIAATGTYRCAAGFCSAHVAAPLAALTTGLGLRDRHLRERFLDAARFPELTVDLLAVPEPAGPAPFPVAVDARIAAGGKSSVVPVRADCRRDGAAILCEIRALTWDLGRHGLLPPSLLGLAVAPRIEVRGRVRLTRNL